jgi:hypothetical protein
MTPAGFPHSDIHGSTLASSSPWLFAGSRVLHRLLTPRHPPCALCSLTSSLVLPRGISRRPGAALPVQCVGGRARGSIRHRVLAAYLALVSRDSPHHRLCRHRSGSPSSQDGFDHLFVIFVCQRTIPPVAPLALLGLMLLCAEIFWKTREWRIPGSNR